MTKFVLGATVGFEEDEVHEFKMHCCMVKEEIYGKGGLRTKRAVSR